MLKFQFGDIFDESSIFPRNVTEMRLQFRHLLSGCRRTTRKYSKHWTKFIGHQKFFDQDFEVITSGLPFLHHLWDG